METTFKLIPMKRESDIQSKATQEPDNSPLVIGKKIPKDKSQPPVILSATKIGDDCIMIESTDSKAIKFVDNSSEKFNLKNISQFAQKDQQNESFINFMNRQNTPSNNIMTPLTVVRNSVRSTNQQMVTSSEVLQYIEQVKQSSRNISSMEQKKLYELCLTSYSQLLEDKTELTVPKSVMSNLADMRKILESSMSHPMTPKNGMNQMNQMNPIPMNQVNNAKTINFNSVQRPTFSEPKTDVGTHLNPLTNTNSAENFSPKNFMSYTPEMLQMLQSCNELSPTLFHVQNFMNYFGNSSPHRFTSPQQYLPSPFNTGRHNQQMFRQNNDFSGYFDLWKSYGYNANAKNQ
jgi:hypothetical protein